MPGIAVAEALGARDPLAEAVFLTRGGGLEERILRKARLPLRAVRAAPLARAPAAAVRGGVALAAGVLQSLWHLARLRPRTVVGLGGYVSAPVLVAARLLGVPIVLMEQNAVAGRVNRLFAGGASAVFLSWEGTTGGGGRVVGNPVRRALRAARPVPAGERPPTVLILGGSQGARGVNGIVCGMLPRAREALPPGTRFRHICGRGAREAVAAAYAAAGITAEVREFVDEIGDWYASADVAVSRAGGTTLAELAAFGLPAVLVPLPFAAEDHQRVNARVFSRAGAALVVEEGKEASERCLDAVAGVLKDGAAAHRMREAARGLDRPGAAEEIAAALLDAAPAAGRRDRSP